MSRTLPIVASLLAALPALPALPALAEAPRPAGGAVEAVRFVHGAPAHGVPGPWALTGYRIGENALKRLGLRREQAWELQVTHRSPAKVQYTCMMDGLMASTGVSPGKMNLAFEEVAGPEALETVVTHKPSGRRLVYRLIPAYAERISKVDYAQFPEAAKSLEATPDAQMFTVVEEAAPKEPGRR